jgi:hypothetical protein
MVNKKKTVPKNLIRKISREKYKIDSRLLRNYNDYQYLVTPINRDVNKVIKQALKNIKR